MILLFTDFGIAGPYVGQMEVVLSTAAPGVPVVALISDVPRFDARAGAYLLPAYAAPCPPGSVFLCVVDPGVGSSRDALALRTEGHWYVGPDNGLLALAARRASKARLWRITWRPTQLSASFHGRDLFAPLAARLACGEAPPGEVLDPADMVGADWPDDLAQVVYIDSFGNAVTGLRAAALGERGVIVSGGHRLARAHTFSDVARGQGFWYENANGLAEIAVNQGRAETSFGLAVGDPIQID